MSLLSRQLSLPDAEFFYVLFCFGGTSLAFYLLLVTYVKNPLLRNNSEVFQSRRAMRLLRPSVAGCICLTLPL